MPKDLVKSHNLAISERGTKTRHTEAEVDLALRLVALSGGKFTVAIEQLNAENIRLSRQTLELWCSQTFPQRFWQIRLDLSREVGEDVAGRALERARRTDEAQELALEQTIKQIDHIPPAHLAKAVLALSTSKAQDVQTSQLLRDRPTKIERIDVAASISVLEKLGVLEKPEVIEAEVVEEGSA